MRVNYLSQCGRLRIGLVHENAGTASALLGLLQLGIGALISGTIGLFDIKDTFPTVTAIFLSATIRLSILKSSSIVPKLSSKRPS